MPYTVRFETLGNCRRVFGRPVSPRRSPPGRDSGRRGVQRTRHVRQVPGAHPDGAGPTASRHRNHRRRSRCARTGLPAGVYAPGGSGSGTVEILPIISHGKGEAPPLERAFELAPTVRRLIVTLEPPSLDRPVDDGSNLLAALADAGLPHITEMDYRAAQELPEVVRSADWRVAVSVRSATGEPHGRQGIRPADPQGGLRAASTPGRYAPTTGQGEVIGIRPAAHAAPPLGLAVDLGTNDVAASLQPGYRQHFWGCWAANPLASYEPHPVTAGLTRQPRTTAPGCSAHWSRHSIC